MFRIGADRTAELVGAHRLTSGGLVAVEGGLAAGDRVVVRGGETLQPGQKVQIRRRTPPTHRRRRRGLTAAIAG